MSLKNSWLVKIPIAHRGLHCEGAPENTIPAFLRAVQKGYAVETDLRMTKDGRVVVFHDDDLMRATGTNLKIEESNYGDISGYGLFGSSERIPLFSEFLKAIDGRTPILIEVKPHGDIGTLEKRIVDILADYEGEVALQSFNPFIIKWFKDNAPELTRGILSASFKEERLSFFTKFILRNLLLAKKCGAMFISYRFTDLNRRVMRLRKRLPLLVYTVRSKSDLEKIKGRCDNIIFEGFEPD